MTGKMLASSVLPANVVLEDVGCPLGCAAADSTVVEGRDRISGVGGVFQVVRCRSCGLARTNPRPTRESMGAYYPDDYAPYQYTKARLPTKRKRSLARAAGQRLINFNSDRLPPELGGHALEIGCASGAYMDYLSTLRLSVEGVELNTSAAEVARQRGYRVQNCVVEAMDPPEKPVSLVVAWMVLEHLHDPVGALARLREWADPDAWLVASVPNFAPLAASLFRSEWYPLQLPCHLFHYTPETLGAVIGRAGWRLERVFYHRTLNDFVATGGNWAESAGYVKLGDRLRTVAKKRNFHLAAYPLAAVASLFGQTGRMTIWAKREG